MPRPRYRFQVFPCAHLSLAVLAFACAPCGGLWAETNSTANSASIVAIHPETTSADAIIVATLPASSDEAILLLPGGEQSASLGVPAGDTQWTLGPNEDAFLTSECPDESWTWKWSPTGLIYHSYLAGPHEPHMALVSFYDGHDRALWDASLGARVGFLRYGDSNPSRPQGYQFDFYGAAIARLDVEHHQDLESTDYVFGFPLTYGIDDWQFKFGYAHVSSHLGDERAIRENNALDERINYVRDGLVFGASRYAYPFLRNYCEVGWAFHTSGGAEPLELQFGSEFSSPAATSRFSPFLAVNAHLREEQSFGGDFALQTGWLRRGEYGQTFRFGLHFFTGKSSQYQFFEESEEQLGLGVWYDL